VNGRRCQAFRRVGCSKFEAADNDTYIGTPYEDVLVLEDEHLELVHTAQEHHNERWEPKDRFMLKRPTYSARLDESDAESDAESGNGNNDDIDDEPEAGSAPRPAEDSILELRKGIQRLNVFMRP
jgi:hypothetical protein